MVSGRAKRVAPVDVAGEVTLEKVADPPPVVPPQPRVAQPQVATHIFTPPLIVKTDVKPDERPPENDSLDHVRISTTTQQGVADDGIPGPPVSEGLGKDVVAAPKATENDAPFERVEIDASFPGGLAAWARFLNRNLRVPDEAISNGIGGTVVVQFIVDVDGNVSDVEAISGPETGGLQEEAVRVIRKSGKWVPAIQNGRRVKAYRRQPVIFQVVEN